MMEPTGLTTATAWDLADLIRTKQVSPVDVVAHFLDRVQAFDGELNAFITVSGDEAMTEAHLAERAVLAGEPLGPMHGVPIGIKDMSATKGIRTTYGSLLQQNNVPDQDSIPVERIRAAGAIVVGKTNTPEFGWKATTENMLTGACHNPWDLARTPGGSSGGSAAAVAARLVPFAAGGDGGGSVRIPASFCGTYGIKPTGGRVPNAYSETGGWLVLDQNGPLTNTVRDAALLLSAMSGHDPRDPRSIAAPAPDFLAMVDEASVEGLRIGWSPAMDGVPVDEEVAALTAQAALAFEALGASVVEETPDVSTERTMELWGTIFLVDYAVALGPAIKAGFGSTLPPKLVEWISEAMAFPATRLAAALRDRELHRARFARFFERYDLLLTPTMATAAFSIDRHPSVIGGRAVDPLSGFTPFCFHANVAGLPAASVPCGFTSEGLPVGLQIVGAWGDEEAVLAASTAFEQARPWIGHRPPRST
jgi:Asp-tRNA(Asn)/Glu-tRNA(Gln) amidotransferase A subunit family amidase